MAECGCKIVFEDEGDMHKTPGAVTFARIEYCPLHSAAEKLRDAAIPLATFADYADAHPRTGLADNLYGWDAEAWLHLSDLRKLRDALAAAKGDKP